MGHRANFVLIRNGQATAYCDQWAALGSTYMFAAGPTEAAELAEQLDATDELLDWAFAEAGYLIDFDERVAIVFGYPEPLEELFEEQEEALEGFDPHHVARDAEAALENGPLAFLQSIAARWPGWLLYWDERGVDVFSAHLARRAIHSITTQATSYPEECQDVVSFQA